MADRFNDYREITAQHASTGTCGHPIQPSDRIGWNRKTKHARCKTCWATWKAENASADFDERQYGR